MSLLQELTIENLEKWLESLEKDEVVGKANSSFNCPIANFLREKGFSDVVVKSHFVSYFDKEQKFYELFELPDWTIMFIEIIDNDRLELNSSILAFDALLALNAL